MAISLPAVGVRFQAQDVATVQAAIRALTNAANQAQRQVAGVAMGTVGQTRTLSTSFVDAGGNITAFGKKSMTALNATGFALSQLAATGQVSFKSLATGATGFLAFFGPTGAIAAAVISAGLILTDFWRRQRKEISETEKLVKDLDDEVKARRRKEDPTEVPRLKLSGVNKDIEENNAELQRLVERRNRILAAIPKGSQPALVERQTAGVDEDIRKNATERTRLEQRAFEATQQLIEARKSLGDTTRKVSDDEVAALAKTLAAGKATAAEYQRANVILGQAQFALDALNRSGLQDAQTTIARAAALDRIKTITDAFAEAEKRRKDAADEVRKALDAELDALVALAQVRKLTGAETLRVLAIEGQLTAQLAAGLPTKAAEAEVWDRIAKARKAAAIAIPPVGVRDPLGGGTFGPGLGSTTEGVVGPVKTLPQPNTADPDFGNFEAFKNSVNKSAQAQFDRAAFATLEEQIAQSLGAAIAGGIADGFARGFAEGGIGEGLKQMLGEVASSLGAIMIQIGQQVIASSSLIQAAVTAILSLNPIAAFAAGVALVAFGSALKGRGGGKGGRSASSGGSGAGLDAIRGFVYGPGANTALKDIDKAIRPYVEQLRKTTFGAPDIAGNHRVSGSGAMGLPPTVRSPLDGITFLVANTPAGQSFIVREVVNPMRQRGG